MILKNAAIKHAKVRGSDVGWYVMQSKVRQERVAECNLQRLGVTTFCPLFARVKGSRGKLHNVKEPLFPGYLFVHVNITSEFRKVAYAKGVLRVVMFGAKPAAVGEDIIHSIKSQMKDGYVIVSAQSKPQLNPGQIVRVKSGPFHGFQAIFEQEFSGTQRVALLMKAVGYQGRIIIDRNSIVV
ncbi:MAG: transcription termination/antitermination NusG family protein [Nitrospirales bacterium]|nr:hypothetical protein [Nitrospirales bacterium]